MTRRGRLSRFSVLALDTTLTGQLGRGESRYVCYVTNEPLFDHRRCIASAMLGRSIRALAVLNHQPWSTPKLNTLRAYSSVSRSNPALSPVANAHPLSNIQTPSHPTEVSKPPQTRVRRFLRTLTPSRLTKRDFVDLSRRTNPRIKIPIDFDGDTAISYTTHILSYYRGAGGGDRRFFPFPPNSSGFFYLHKVPGAPEFTAEVRFRITLNRNPESFHSGRDLLLHGMPWNVSLRNQRASRYDSLLFHEGHVTHGILEARPRLEAMHPGKQLSFVFGFKQPFLLQHNYNQIKICGVEEGVSKVERIGWPILGSATQLRKDQCGVFILLSSLS